MLTCLVSSAGALGQGAQLPPQVNIATPAAAAGELPSPLPLRLPGLDGVEKPAEAAGNSLVTRGPRPSWVLDVPAPEVSAAREKLLLREGLAADGVLYLVHSTQVNVAELATHTFVERKILNVRGAQSTVKLSVPFNPAFEKLRFHKVVVERDGKELDRLADLNFRLYQKEDRAAELVFRGALQAVAFIPDLLPGDILRFSYTVQGGHPLFSGKFDDMLMLNVNGVEEKRHVRLLSMAEQPLQTEIHGGKVSPETRALPGGILEQTWVQLKKPVPTVESELPEWFWPFPVLQATHFTSWQEVATVFAPLYAAPTENGPLYGEALAKVRAAGDSEREQIQAALTLVRDEVRYLSLSEGDGGFRPQEPEEVLRTRLGDCKDKTRLLCRLLVDLGLDASPALVSSRERGHLSKIRPSPNAFDHVIVELKWKGEKYWLDATINQESRDFRRDYFPHFGRALVLAPDTTELTTIGSEAQATKRVSVRTQYHISGSQAPADLRVTSIYSGAAAYQERELQAVSGKQMMDSMLLEVNASRYDALMLGKPRSVKDDLNRNQLTSVEEYVIPQLWQDPEGEGRNIAIFRASELPAMLVTQMASLPRRQPLKVEHPVHVTEEIEIISPIASEATPKSYVIEAPSFRFSHQVKVEGTKLRLVYDYKTTSDVVPANQTAKQLEKLNEVIGLLAYSIRYPEQFGEKAGARGLQLEGEPQKPPVKSRAGRNGRPHVRVRQ